MKIVLSILSIVFIGVTLSSVLAVPTDDFITDDDMGGAETKTIKELVDKLESKKEELSKAGNQLTECGIQGTKEAGIKHDALKSETRNKINEECGPSFAIAKSKNIDVAECKNPATFFFSQAKSVFDSVTKCYSDKISDGFERLKKATEIIENLIHELKGAIHETQQCYHNKAPGIDALIRIPQCSMEVKVKYGMAIVTKAPEALIEAGQVVYYVLSLIPQVKLCELVKVGEVGLNTMSGIPKVVDEVKTCITRKIQTPGAPGIPSMSGGPSSTGW